MLPLQVIDSFLINYNVGQALLLVFVMGTFGVLPLKSRKVLGLHFIAFGIVFLLTPQTLVPIHYLYLGIALVVVGPMVYVSGTD